MKDFEELILEHNVISFDIFDTLLFRPYINPDHLFLHMEKVFNCKGFTEKRGLASKKARKEAVREDITIDDIYANMPEEMLYLKECEIDFEVKHLRKNKKIYEIYKFAREHNKKIVIISDMYLPEEALTQALINNGYDKFDSFYLSGKIGLTKRSGKLFKYFLEKENINPKEVLHIGDHFKSDIQMAELHGIDTYQCYRNSDLFFEDTKNLKFKKLYKKNKDSLTLSAILSLLCQKYYENKDLLNNKDNYFKDFGYCIAGCVAYGFCNYILQNISNNDEIICIARDGYNIEKILKKLKPDLSTHYVYAQRIFANKLNLNGDTSDNFEKNKAYYRNYLISLGIDFNKNLVLCDSGASSFTAQRIIEKVLDKKLLGIYSMVAKTKNIEKYNIDCKTWAQNKNDINYITSLIEFIFMAPEPPIVDLIDNKPIYMKNVSDKELELNKLSPIISDSILEFVSDIQNYFVYPIPFDLTDLEEFIKCFVMNLTELDKQMFNNVYYSANVENTSYLPLLRKIYKLSKCPKYYFDRIIFNFKIKVLKQYSKI